MQGRAQRSVYLHAGGSCELDCALCDCRFTPSPPDFVARALRDGGTRLVLRGGNGANPALEGLVRDARARGFADVVVRTNALAAALPGGAAQLARCGADAVLVPIFSHASAVHDRVAGRPGALAQALAGMRALAAAGLAVEIETALLPPNLHRPREVVELARRAVPALRRARFFLPRWKVPAPLAPPRWSAEAGPLAQALERCRELGVAAELSLMDAVPLCALRDRPDLHEHFRFGPGSGDGPAPGCAHGKACEACVVRRHCPGISAAYAAVHGEADLAPFERRPGELFRAQQGPRRRWSDEQRRSASVARLLVLRPTVRCNQDCPFCSANETSGNVWEEPGRMLRRIARAARRGVTRLSFSGGEPTLSRDLVSYVRAARRLGLGRIELVTNAVLLDRPERVQALAEAGLTHAFVSLHAHDERLARLQTRRAGDFERTVRAVRLLLGAKIAVCLNHVVNARNLRYLPRFVEFVHDHLPGTLVSFAFASPLYKALEQPDLLPRLFEAAPHVREALRRALALGVPVVVGSRQGIPPCFLKEFRAWSDVFSVAREALSEDAPQKTPAPACAACRYRAVCPGLWKAYAARHGLEEPVAVPGEPFGEEELRALRRIARDPPWSVPRSFDEVPEFLRERVAEAEVVAPEPVLEPDERVAAGAERSRPLRVLLAGTGPRAHALARAAPAAGLDVGGVVSPHAPEASTAAFGGCPAWDDPVQALDDIRPEALIVAAAPRAHAPLVRLALARGLPALVEMPLAPDPAEADALAAEAQAARGLLVPALDERHAPGIADVFAVAPGRVSLSRRLIRGGGRTPAAWSRSALRDVLTEALSLLQRAAGGGPARVAGAWYRGEAAPESLRLALAYAAGEAQISLDFSAGEEETLLRLEPAGAEAIAWHRRGRHAVLRRASGEQVVRGPEEEVALLADFRDAVLGLRPPASTAAEAAALLHDVENALDALQGAGAPLDREGPRRAREPRTAAEGAP